MKAENRLKELIESGEINSLDAARQEGFIKGWGEALRIHDVVEQSEQFCYIRGCKHKGTTWVNEVTLLCDKHKQ